MSWLFGLFALAGLALVARWLLGGRAAGGRGGAPQAAPAAKKPRRQRKKKDAAAEGSGTAPTGAAKGKAAAAAWSESSELEEEEEAARGPDPDLAASGFVDEGWQEEPWETVRTAGRKPAGRAGGAAASGSVRPGSGGKAAAASLRKKAAAHVCERPGCGADGKRKCGRCGKVGCLGRGALPFKALGICYRVFPQIWGLAGLAWCCAALQSVSSAATTSGPQLRRRSLLAGVVLHPRVCHERLGAALPCLRVVEGPVGCRNTWM